MEQDLPRLTQQDTETAATYTRTNLIESVKGVLIWGLIATLCTFFDSSDHFYKAFAIIGSWIVCALYVLLMCKYCITYRRFRLLRDKIK